VSSNRQSAEPINLKTSEFDLTDCLRSLFNELVEKYGYSAYLLCNKIPEQTGFKVLSSHAIPITPFNGAKSESLNKFLDDCYQSYPAPHVHSIKSSQLWTDIASICNTEGWFSRVVFLPFQYDDYHFTLLFFGDQLSIKQITSELTESTTSIINTALFYLQRDETQTNLRVMETYVKEVGHDISSSVQSIISKLRNVRRGLISGKAAERKLEEAESEIMATHRTADTLGIAVDSDYNIRSGHDLDVCDVVNTVISRCESEASERNCLIRPKLPDNPVILWGDMKAIDSAVTQFVINAIKYSHGGSTITIKVKDSDESIEVDVVNIGSPLEDNLSERMWGFGERGVKALEQHVNGSGIGLYTVQKIVKAHKGTTSFKSDKNTPGLAIFSFKIPKGSILEKTKLL